LSEFFVSDELLSSPCEPPYDDDTEDSEFAVLECAGVGVYGTGGGVLVPEAEIICMSKLCFCHICLSYLQRTEYLRTSKPLKAYKRSNLTVQATSDRSQ